MFNKKLSAWAQRRNYRLTCASPECLGHIRNTIDNLRSSKAIDNEFFKNWLADFRYIEDCAISHPLSLVVIAVPRPAHVLKFELSERTLKTVLPPTYVQYQPLFEAVKADFQQHITNEKYEVEILRAPLKSLAAYLGLVRYGRNNITYIRDFGSYFQLVCLATTLPWKYLADTTVTAHDFEKQMLEDCRTCRRCMKACSAGAITEDRFLIRAQNCYTAFSESLKPLPDGIKPPSPQCLMGCMKCQLACPVNRGLLKYEQAPVSFNREETAYMLSEEPPYSDEPWNRIAEKFAVLGLTEPPAVFARNLRRMVS